MTTTEITNSQDILDSRDIQERIDYLESLEDADEADKEELGELVALKEEAFSSEWECGITFISEDSFEDYAREFAEDIGAIQDDTNWPSNCIDWEQAARELRMDYTEVDFDGVAYLFR